MSYEVPEKPPNVDSAFDGDCDIAYALLLADKQWGSAGRINYRDAAAQVLAGILASTIGPSSRLPMLGDWVDPNGPLYNQYTPRSSDFMTGHFRAFGRSTGDPVWSQVVANTQAVISQLQSRFSPGTGLLPDFIVPVSRVDRAPMPAPPNFLEGPNDGDYSYNACRDPWRLGTDALLSGDPASLAQARKIANWARLAAGGNADRIRPGYRLDGRPLSGDYFTTVFVAPIAVAAMTEPSQQQWLDDLYDAVHGRFEDYYEDSVTLLCLLVMTGNFWDPSTIG
jgi:endo-1,4-beta-D-glucanase Y